MVSFKGAQYPKGVILYAVFFYVRYGVSFEELMEERGLCVDHFTLNRWLVRYSPQIANEAQKKANGGWFLSYG
ncbi:MAG: putative transposase [Cellvibrionaceae bacterium]|jgi:putative transposase